MATDEFINDDIADARKYIAESGVTGYLLKAGFTPEEEFRFVMSHVGMSKQGIDNIINAGFCSAPASTKYHLNYSGGLYEHSANVANALKTLTNSLKLRWERDESPIIIGMLHDLCKVDQYKPKDDGIYGYEWDSSPIIKGHGMKSVVYIQQLGNFKLTDEEVACIVYHMGAFTDSSEWNDYTNAIHKYPNVLYTHTADMMATHITEVM